MRKSPIRHHVRKHRRNNRPVHDYMRGKGSHPSKVTKPHLKRNTQTPKSYAVQIAYESQSPETIIVNASNHDQAIELAMAVRRSLTPPFEVRCALR